MVIKDKIPADRSDGYIMIKDKIPADRRDRYMKDKRPLGRAGPGPANRALRHCRGSQL